MAASLKTHDCTLEDASSGSPKIGLMLARKKGQRGFTVGDYPTIAPRVLTNQELDAAQLPPQVELTWMQEDWRAGLGGRNHRLDPKRYASSVKIDATVEGLLRLARDLIVTTDDSAPTAYKPGGFAIVGTEIWSFQERDVYSLTYATNQWVKATAPQAVAVVYRNGVAFGGNTYVPAWLTADDSAGTYIYRADADANDGAGAGVEWTLSTVTVKTFKYFCRSRNADGDEILIGGNAGGANTHRIYSTTDPTNAVAGTWTQLPAIGNSDAEITGLVSDGNAVIVLKTNGVWAYYADGSVENLTSEFEGQADPDNFRNAFNWNGHVLLPLGSGGLYELVEGKLYDISLKRSAPDQTTLQGRVLAITGDATRLFIAVLDTTNLKYHLLMATWDEFQGKQDFRWHHVGSVTYTGTMTTAIANHATLMAEGIPSGSTLHHRIWMGVEGPSNSLLPYYYPLPDPDDANLVFTNDDDGELITTLWDANLPQVKKLYTKIDFTTAGLGAAGTDHYIEVKYRVDGGSWTYVTGAQGTSTLTTTPQTLSFGVEVTGKTLELQFLFFQGTTTTTTPQIKNFTVRGALRPGAINAINLECVLADNMTLLNGARGGTPKADLAQLIAWDAAANDLVFKGPGIVTAGLAVLMLPGSLSYRESYTMNRRRAEYLVTFALAQKT